MALTSSTLRSIRSTIRTVLMPRHLHRVGRAQVQVYGSQKYAVRVSLDPRELAARGIASTT